MENVTINIASPIDMKDEDLSAISELVAEGGQIKLKEKDLLFRIISSRIIIFIKNEDKLIGCLCIKNQNKDYIESVFNTFNLRSFTEIVRCEIGYGAVDKKFRKMGYFSMMMELCMEFLQSQTEENVEHPVVFGTTRDKFIAESICNNFGFRTKEVEGLHFVIKVLENEVPVQDV